MKSKLLITIFLLLSLTVGVASADAAFTNFTAYGDAWISNNDTYTVIKWNSTGARAAWNATGNVTSATTIEYAMVGGGGGGGKALGGGGGGAGAFWEGTTTGLTGAQTVAVGAGGAQASANNTVGTPGGASTFTSIVAIGGSGGGSAYMSNVTQGGSAGGAGVLYNGGSNNIWYTNTSNSTGHGNRGGYAMWNSTTLYAGGGGGGYARFGLNATRNAGGSGGKAGMTNISGTMYALAGGGGGGTYNNSIAARGLGGDNTTAGITTGGNGGYRTTAATAALASTGSGGGGGGSTGAGTAGSGGVIFIRWKTIPNSSFTANTTGGTTPIAVAFTDTSINGTATAWNWSFNNVTGNNTKVWWSTTQNPSITFGAGNWSILLNASSDGGYNWSLQTTFVNVSTASVPAPPVASFTANVSSGTDPTYVAFTDTSTNTPTGWNWAAKNVTGNNTWFAFNTTQNPTQRFGIGNWSINLTATNADGSDISDQTTLINVTLSTGETIEMMYPAAGEDARVKRDGVDEAWATIIGGAGTAVDATQTTSYVEIDSTSTLNQYSGVTMVVFSMNTSTLPDDATITGATMGWFVTGISNIWDSEYVITGFVPTTNGSFVTGDFQKYTSALYSNKIPVGSITANQYTNWTATPAFIANISKTGYTNFAIRDANFANGTAPIWSESQLNYIKGAMADNATLKPFLRVTYTTGGGTTSPTSSFSTSKHILRIPNAVACTDTSADTPTVWNWSWGDGTWTNGTTQNANHTYTKRGIFSIFLLSSNAGGSNTSASQNVRVVGYENLW